MYVKGILSAGSPCLGEAMIPLWLLLIFAACGVASALLCGIAMLLFPRFRSGEFKPGPHRSDLEAGGREIKTIELPLVGGPAFTLALIAKIGRASCRERV